MTGTDWERVILVPATLLLFGWSMFGLFAGIGSAAASSPLTAVAVAYRVLLCAYYVLIVVLLALRSAPKARSRRFLPRAAAYLGTFLPLVIPFAGGSKVSIAVATLGLVLMVLGIALALWGLITLSTSFGVEPQVRRLVQRGPYCCIRHPLYAGEMASFVGAACFSPSFAKVAILVLEVAIQVYRAVQEERLFEATLPHYAEYKRRTKRFVPGLL